MDIRVNTEKKTLMVMDESVPFADLLNLVKMMNLEGYSLVRPVPAGGHSFGKRDRSDDVSIANLPHITYPGYNQKLANVTPALIHRRISVPVPDSGNTCIARSSAEVLECCGENGCIKSTGVTPSYTSDHIEIK